MEPQRFWTLLHNEITHVFETENDLMEYADAIGHFEDCWGKNGWLRRYDNTIEEVSINDLHNYEPLHYHFKRDSYAK